ncbi:thioredoxin [Candidatus Falkowbacteria bacterium]|nr:thioredoxin [Candidatus Falkowbacteria bacterium]
MSLPITLTKENFEEEVIKSDLPVIVDFWAEWCGPCRMMAPVLDELAAKLEGKVKFAKLDVNNPEHEELSEKYQIQGIPAFKVFKGGAVVKEMTGYQPAESLESALAEIIG